MDDMNTRIGQLFTPQTYKAEHTDTRQAIRRHEPEYEQQRRGKDSRDGQSSEFDMEDHADVSVSALKSFLQDFLKSMEQQNPKPNSPSSEMPIADGNEHAEQAESPVRPARPVSPHAAHAAHAYRTTAQKTSGHQPVQGGADKAESLGLASTDIRVIHELIQELGQLEVAGIQNLRIERGASFLESLRNAVQKATFHAS